MSAGNCALADLRELVALSALEPTGMLDLFEDLRSLANDGLPALVADVDGLAAVPTIGAVPAYKLPDRLKVRLAALRARHVDAGKVECAGSVHKSPQVYNSLDPRIELVAAAIVEGLKRNSGELFFLSGPDMGTDFLLSFEGTFRLRDLAVYVLSQLDHSAIVRV